MKFAAIIRIKTRLEYDVVCVNVCVYSAEKRLSTTGATFQLLRQLAIQKNFLPNSELSFH